MVLLKPLRKMVVKPKTELNEKEIFSLSRDDRELYIQRYILSLLESNKTSGLTLNTLNRLVTFVSKPTLLKHLNTLMAKRQIYKVKRGNAVEYYPNHRPLHPLISKIITLQKKKYKFQLIEYEDGLQLYIQEINRNVYGKEEVAGGILIPFTDLNQITTYLQKIEKEKLKIIENFKQQKIKEIESKIDGEEYNEY
ncbi:MAG: hypothetical protein ABH804_01615 [archaeon]